MMLDLPYFASQTKRSFEFVESEVVATFGQDDDNPLEEFRQIRVATSEDGPEQEVENFADFRHRRLRDADTVDRDLLSKLKTSIYSLV